AAGCLTGGPRNVRAVTALIRIFPRPRRPRPSAFQGLHLGRIGASLVFIVHCGPDSITDQAADGRAGNAGGELGRHIAADRRTEETSRDGADRGPGVLFGTLAGLGRGSAPADTSGDQQNNRNFGWKHPILSGSPRESRPSSPSSAVCRDRRSAKSQEWGESAANQQIQRVAASSRHVRHAQLAGRWSAEELTVPTAIGWGGGQRSGPKLLMGQERGHQPRRGIGRNYTLV